MALSNLPFHTPEFRVSGNRLSVSSEKIPFDDRLDALVRGRMFHQSFSQLTGRHSSLISRTNISKEGQLTGNYRSAPCVVDQMVQTDDLLVPPAPVQSHTTNKIPCRRHTQTEMLETDTVRTQLAPIRLKTILKKMFAKSPSSSRPNPLPKSRKSQDKPQVVASPPVPVPYEEVWHNEDLVSEAEAEDEQIEVECDGEVGQWVEPTSENEYDSAGKQEEDEDEGYRYEYVEVSEYEVEVVEGDSDKPEPIYEYAEGSDDDFIYLVNTPVDPATLPSEVARRKSGVARLSRSDSLGDRGVQHQSAAHQRRLLDERAVLDFQGSIGSGKSILHEAVRQNRGDLVNILRDLSSNFELTDVILLDRHIKLLKHSVIGRSCWSKGDPPPLILAENMAQKYRVPISGMSSIQQQRIKEEREKVNLCITALGGNPIQFPD